jgi:hypothetical protein
MGVQSLIAYGGGLRPYGGDGAYGDFIATDSYTQTSRPKRP